MLWVDVVLIVVGVVGLSLIAYELSKTPKGMLLLLLLSVLFLIVCVWLFFRVRRVFYDIGGWFWQPWC